MAAEIFTAISALRMVLDSETDADSPDNETTFAAMRVAIESLFMILLGTGVSGTVVTITETVLTDTGNFVSGAHVDHTLVMTSGDAKGNMYTIDGNTSHYVACNGDTMASDGVAEDDTYVILYDTKTNTGHTHDAKNAASVDLADDSVNSEHYAAGSIDAEHYAAASVPKTAIHTGTGTSSAAISTLNWYSIELQDYCFSPNICGTDKYFHVRNYSGVVAEYSAKFAVYNEHGSTQTYTVHYRYVTSSDEPFVYSIRDGDTGVILATWACEDPPSRYWGLDEKPVDFIPPLISSDPPENMEEIVIFKYPKEAYFGLVDKAATDKKPIHELIDKDYDYDSDKKLFVTKNLTMI